MHESAWMPGAGILSRSLLLLLAVFAISAHASEQGILPDLRFHFNNTTYKTAEATFAAVKALYASRGLPAPTNFRPCSRYNFHNDVADMWCWTDPSAPEAGFASTTWECPAEAPGNVTIVLPDGRYRVYCRTPVDRPQPPPPEASADSCLGNPIQVDTRIKIQRDFDIGLGSLRFERVYTSNTGEWRHTYSTSAWNLELNSLANLSSNPSPGCFSGTVSVFTPKERVCLPYISNSDVGRTGAADWLVHRDDGRTVGISSVSQRAIDAGTRETARAVVSGGNFDGLVVYDGSDMVEFFDREGRLTRRSQLKGGGSVLTYLTPTGQKFPASAPDCNGISVGAGVVGRPSCVTDIVTGRQLIFAYDSAGRLISTSDPSGHSVTYQYNGPTSSGTYAGYDALTSVTYPGQAERKYHYNESSLTSNTSLPRALTGITDETNTRYAYFGYSSTQVALTTSHANGIDSYTIVPSTGEVTDALGRKSTYGPRTITKTASDGSLASKVTLPGTCQIPVPAGGTATKQREYDAAGNLTLLRDFKGNQTRYEYDLTRNYETLRIVLLC